MKKPLNIKNSLLLWISLIVPSFITSLIDFDISIFATYSLIASLLGLKTVLLLILVYFCVHAINGISGKIVIVTGKGLIELIREYFGIKISFYIFAITFLLNFMVIMQNYLAVKLIADLFNLDFWFISLILTIYLFLIFYYKLYKFTNRIFIFIALFYSSVIFLVINKLPLISQTLLNARFTVYDLLQNHNSLYLLALLGVTVSAWNQLLISRYTYRTKLNLDKLDYHVLDNRTSTFFSFCYSAAFISAIWILFPNGLILNISNENLASFIALQQPIIKNLFFGIGLLSIAISGIYAVTLSLTHVFTEFFGQERTNEEQPQFLTNNLYFYLLLTIPALILTNFLKIQLFNTAIVFGFIQSLFIPILLYFIYYFSNKKQLMGRYVNDIIHNIMLTGIALFISILFFITIIRFVLQI